MDVIGTLNKGLHAAGDAVQGLEHAVGAAADGFKDAAGHVVKGTVESAEAAAMGAEHVVTHTAQGGAKAGHDLAEGLRSGHVLQGVRHAWRDGNKEVGQGLSEGWDTVKHGAETSLNENMAAVRAAGAGMGQAYNKVVDGVAHAAGDAAGKKAGDAVKQTLQQAAAPVRAAANFAGGFVDTFAHDAMGMVTGTGDLIEGGVKMGTDAQYRDKLIAKAADTAANLGQAELDALHNPRAAVDKLENAAKGAWNGFMDKGVKAMNEGRGAEFDGKFVGGIAFTALSMLWPFAKAGAVGKVAASVKVAGDVDEGVTAVTGAAKGAGEVPGMRPHASDLPGGTGESPPSPGAAPPEQPAPSTAAGGNGGAGAKPPEPPQATGPEPGGAEPGDPQGGPDAQGPAGPPLSGPKGPPPARPPAFYRAMEAQLKKASNSLASRSPTFAMQQAEAEEAGWRVKVGPREEGCYTKHSEKLVRIGASVNTDDMAFRDMSIQEAHEYGHAFGDMPEAEILPGMDKATYMQSNMAVMQRNEGGGLLNELKVRDELARSDPEAAARTTPLNKGLEARCRPIYEKYAANAIDEEQARIQLGDAVRTEHPSNNPAITYEQDWQWHSEAQWQEWHMQHGGTPGTP